MSAQHIISVYNLASQSDINSGKDWYDRALTFADNLGELYNIPYTTIVGVIASLSPRNRWERNLQDAESLVKVYAAGGDEADLLNVKCCTFTPNKLKAIRILVNKVSDRSELLSILSGPKLQEFFNCIIGDSGDVCIDGHAYSIWLGERVTLANVPSIGKKLRQTIKADYQAAANTLGVEPHIVQAITWVCWKRIHGV